MPAAPEVMFGSYRVQDLLGRGGMGEVHRAYDTVHGRTVALKRLSGTLAGADDRGRFRRESRLAASVREPHVVQVYDYGEIDDQLYLAMQLIEGTDLRTVLEDGPLEPQRAVELLTQVAAAIDAAHTGGVLHRDVKPSNILIDESGTAYLADFGIAKPADGDATSLTRTGNEIGTLDYMAPERVLRQGAERRSDVYALACVLFQCVTGKLPFPAEDTAGKLAAQLHTPPPAPSLFGWRVPQELDLVVTTGMDKDPARRYPSAGELMAAAAVAIAQPSTTATMPTIPEFAADPGRERIMRAIVAGADKGAALADPATEPAAGEPSRPEGRPCPYPGLRSFGAGDAGAFFGREQALTDVLVRLSRLTAESGPLVLVGASGSGKSSLLHAGVLPALERAGGPPWPQLALTPGPSPLEMLAARLAPLAGTGAGELARWLWQRPADFGKLAGQIAHQHGGEHSRLVIVIDQFEELFTVADLRQREVFATALASAWPALVVLAVRADFLEDCIRLDVLRPALAGAHLLGPLSAGELERVITEPAKVAGMAVEPGLIDRLLTDIGARDSTGYDPGALPRLAHALRETWQHRNGNTLTLQGYQATGGIDRAVALTADAIYNALDEYGKAQLRTALLRMVTVLDRGGVARRKAAPGEIPAWLVQHLVDARLVTAEADGVQLSHDALLTAWPRLREWVEQDRQGLVIHQHLGEAAAAWEGGGRDHGELYRGARLSAALEWARGRGDLSEVEQAFLRESQRAQRRTTRRLTGLVAGLSVFLVLALVAGVVALVARSDAVQTSREAESRQLAAESLAQADLDPIGARHKALEAWNISHTTEARGALLSNVVYDYPVMLDSGLSGAYSVAVSGDGKLIAVGGPDGQLAVLDTRTGKPIDAPLTGHMQGVFNLEFSPDSSMLASSSSDSVRVWDMPSGELVRMVPGFNEVAWRPDGKVLATFGTPEAGKVAVAAWKPRTGERLGWLTKPVPAEGAPPHRMAYSVDGKRLAVSRVDGTVELWNPKKPDLVKRMSAHSKGVPEGEPVYVDMTFSDRRLATVAASDGMIRFWDPHSGSALSAISADAPGPAVAFRAGGAQVLIVDDNGIAKWSAQYRRPDGLYARGPHPGDRRDGTIMDIAAPPSGDVLGVQANGTVVRWRDNPSWFSGPPGKVYDVAISPEGDEVAAVDGNTYVWERSPGQATGSVYLRRAFAVAYAPDGTRVVGRQDGTINVFGPGQQQPRELDLPGKDVPNGDIAVSPDGTMIAIEATRPEPDSYASHNTLYVWDTSTFTKRAQLDLGNAVTTNMAFSADSTKLVLASDSVPNLGKPAESASAIRSWRTADFTELPPVEISNHDMGKVLFTADGASLLLAAGKRIQVRDVATGTVRREFAQHPAEVRALVLSPDGSTVATGTVNDPIVRLWDLRTGDLVAKLTGHDGGINELAFSAGGRTLVSAGTDSNVGVWTLDPVQAKSRLCDDLAVVGEPGQSGLGC